MKEVMIFLDESGHIHTNCKDRYFAIGGYCCAKDKSKAESEIKNFAEERPYMFTSRYEI